MSKAKFLYYCVEKSGDKSCNQNASKKPCAKGESQNLGGWTCPVHGSGIKVRRSTNDQS